VSYSNEERRYRNNLIKNLLKEKDFLKKVMYGFKGTDDEITSFLQSRSTSEIEKAQKKIDRVKRDSSGNFREADQFLGKAVLKTEDGRRYVGGDKPGSKEFLDPIGKKTKKRYYKKVEDGVTTYIEAPNKLSSDTPGGRHGKLDEDSHRTRTGPLGFGTERKLYERDGKYYTTLRLVKGGNNPEGPEYVFSRGSDQKRFPERQISYSRYQDLKNKMKRRRLRKLAR
jgi:hypothetical protein